MLFLIEAFMNWLRKLFGKKPAPRPVVHTLNWSGLATPPDTGSFQLAEGTSGKASTGWDLPVSDMPPGTLLKFSVTLSAPVEGGINVMLYRRIGGNVIPGWCPTVAIPAGQQKGEISFTGEVYGPGVQLIAWCGYPPGLGNSKPVDIFAAALVQA